MSKSKYSTNIDNSKEIWKPIPGFEGLYDASTQGRVRRSITWQNHRGSPSRPGLILKISANKLGYCRVPLSKAGRKRAYSVHRIVAATFLGESLDSPLTVNHLDGNKKNNSVINLEWCTAKANCIHSWFNGRAKKLTINDVKRVRYLHTLGFKCVALAAMFKISGGQMSRVLRGQAHKHIR